MTDRSSPYATSETRVDGICFDSGAEARRYAQLKLLQRAGEISELELQPRFDLVGVRGSVVAYYKADFRYREKGGGIVIEDVKSPATAKNPA